MTAVELREPVRTVVLDIEGTTIPLAFVQDILFPYARSQVRQFLEQQHMTDSVRADLSALQQEHQRDVQAALNPPALDWSGQLESLAGYIEWLMARDRKSTGLKSLQGKIWEEGYRSGYLRSSIFDDVAPAFERWEGQDRSIAIFSSGSVRAQQLLFSHTTSGDLTRYISNYFDTITGAKTEAESYRKIAHAVEQSPQEIVFISDVVAELDAATNAGFQVLLCQRIGNRPQPPNPHRRIETFETILP